MREEDREILEEAIRNSAGGEDFDEMLLRSTKKHLPRKYHRQFSVLLDEVLKVADELGVSNRSAAQSIAKTPALLSPAGARPFGIEPMPVAPAPPARMADPTDEIISRHPNQPLAPPRADAAGERKAAPIMQPDRPAGPPPGGERPVQGMPEGTGNASVPSEGSVEKLPEEQKIVDLGGTSPDSLPPELQDKLRKLVKAQKRKQAWEEGAPEEEPAPGLFFKGQQRAPPFVPLTKPAPKPKTEAGQAEKGPEGADDEDLDGPVKK